MSLFLEYGKSDIASMPPSGATVQLTFSAKATKNKPTHMRATFRIDDKDFAFSPLNGSAKTSEVHYPSDSTQIKAPSSYKEFDLDKTRIVPKGADGRRRFGLLQINTNLQGFDATGAVVLPLREFPITIKLDQVSMALGLAGGDSEASNALQEMDPVTAALRLVSKSLGITKAQISRVLDVDPRTVARVLKGESSPKLREALERIFKGK